MAIKVNGTTVIDDSRNLSNVGGLKTVNGTSLVGSGNISAGASTTAGAVGTYTWGRPANVTTYSFGSTASGIYPVSGPTHDSYSEHFWGPSWSNAFENCGTQSQQSGTWRCMSYGPYWGSQKASMALWVRIS